MVKKVIPKITPAQKTTNVPVAGPAETKKLSGKDKRLQGSHFFLTFPKCKIVKEKFNDLFKKVVKVDLDFLVVAQEKHKDGTDHLHVAFKTKKKIKLSFKKLDEITGKRGNYQTARDICKVLTYITKENAFSIYPVQIKTMDDLMGLLKKKVTKKDIKSNLVAQEIANKKSIYEIAKEEPGFVMMNLKRIQDYQSFLQSKPVLKKDLRGFKKAGTDEELIIKRWFKNNVKVKRSFDQQHLFIHGNTQMGKTTFLRSLEPYLNMYMVPMDEDFYDFYSDEFDLVVFEEFKSQKTVQFLNRFMDGFCNLKKKGSQIIKTKPLPCIFLSNYSLAECFPKVYTDRPTVFKTLERRLIEVEVTKFITLRPKKDLKKTVVEDDQEFNDHIPGIDKIPE